MNPKLNNQKLGPSYIIVKPDHQNEEKVLKAAREKRQLISKGTMIRLSADCSHEQQRDRGIFQV